MYTKINGVVNSFRRDRILSVMIGTYLQSKQSEYVGGEELMQHRFANLASSC